VEGGRLCCRKRKVLSLWFDGGVLLLLFGEKKKLAVSEHRQRILQREGKGIGHK